MEVRESTPPQEKWRPWVPGARDGRVSPQNDFTCWQRVADDHGARRKSDSYGIKVLVRSVHGQRECTVAKKVWSPVQESVVTADSLKRST